MNDAQVRAIQTAAKVSEVASQAIFTVATGVTTSDTNSCVAAIGKIQGIAMIRDLLLTELQGAEEGNRTPVPPMPTRNST